MKNHKWRKTKNVCRAITDDIWTCIFIDLLEVPFAFSPVTLCATWQRVCPVSPGLSPDLSSADTHFPCFANCQGKWDGRLISWKVYITHMQVRSSTALSQLRYCGKCLCGDQGLTTTSDAWICVALSPPDLAAVGTMSAAQPDQFCPVSVNCCRLMGYSVITFSSFFHVSGCVGRWPLGATSTKFEVIFVTL